ncbi:MAG: TIGR03960 family B12-binding radical SAM protein [Planctomycetes bacterium]|nr:TIGR03960 family B12-binding radical SAM protein [Planctomycetota bacterium]
MGERATPRSVVASRTFGELTVAMGPVFHYNFLPMSASLWDRIEPLLLEVQSPSQYIGGEWNSIRKEWDSVSIRAAFCFPDVYKIGMSHLGLQILYGLINARPDALCERVFAPWPDLEERMRAQGIPLLSVDSHRPVRDFDVVGFSLQAELAYTNIVNMLDLAGIPVWAAERSDRDPIVAGGGPNGSYPEPIAEFFDVIILGDGEEATLQLLELVRDLRAGGASRRDILRAAAQKVAGAYVPSLYDVAYHPDGTIASITARDGAPTTVKKAVVASLPETYYPEKPIVPYGEVVHDRINLEIMRGCPHRCRFCHAVTFKNKLRFRPVDQLLQQAESVYAHTGYDEIALTSLSSGDYPHIQELMARLNARFKARRVSVTLPSLRIDEKLAELPALLKSVRKSGFTVAPEGGTEALRKIIRKPIKDEDLFATARAAFQEGWNHLKLYFMIGLPGETDEDLQGIIDTARRVSAIGKELRGRWADVNVTISPFIPKPHTPFQFAAQRDFEYVLAVERRLAYLARGTRVHLRMHDPRSSYIEAVFARGSRSLSKAILAAVRAGSKFDEWREFFSFERWMRVFESVGIDPNFIARREIPRAEVLPWDHLDTGTSRDYLWREYQYCLDAISERAGRKPESGASPAPDSTPASHRLRERHPLESEDY